MNTFGFIITRHVNSELTNQYWNHSVKLINTFYPDIKIVIIDDNSNMNFVKADFEYKNLEIINSEFKGRGELLPYYYYIKNKFFENAVIVHDSIFFHTRVNFEILNGINVMPLWFFEPFHEDINNTLRIANNLNNSYSINNTLSLNINIGMPHDKWYGCFGVQSYINHDFLLLLENKYRITNLLSAVVCRNDRCCLERIMGCIFYTLNPKIIYQKALFGEIYKHQKLGYTFNEYMSELKKGTIIRPVIKVWTGR
jgi:hypothetical protein